MARISVSMDSTCSLMRISGFGGRLAQGYSRSYGYEDNTVNAPTLKDFISIVGAQIESYNDATQNSNNFHHQGLVMATVISVQGAPLDVLREFGGWTETTSDKMVKYDHEVIMFVQPVRSFTERFNGYAKSFGLKELTPVPATKRITPV